MTLVEGRAVEVEALRRDATEEGNAEDASPMLSSLTFPLFIVGSAKEEEPGSETSRLVRELNSADRDGPEPTGAYGGTGSCTIGARSCEATDKGDAGSKSCIACIAKEVSKIF
jgi:hypothetical protein